MAVPKKKTSKRRTRNRASANLKVTPVILGKCSQCGELKKQHMVCGFCGYYAGKKVLNIESKLDKKLKKAAKAKEKETKE